MLTIIKYSCSYLFLVITLLFFCLPRVGSCVHHDITTLHHDHYDGRFLTASIPKAKKFFFEVIMPELIGGYFYLKSTMQKEVPANTIENKYLPCYCQQEDPKNLPIVICEDKNCKRKKIHESCIKSKTNPTKRITKIWKCDTCKKGARAVAAAAAKAKKNNFR